MNSSKMTSLIKKPSLDRNDLNNYRSASNLTFISKLIEILVTADLNHYVHGNDIFVPQDSTVHIQIGAMLRPTIYIYIYIYSPKAVL